jgi:hypothetical protein
LADRALRSDQLDFGDAEGEADGDTEVFGDADGDTAAEGDGLIVRLGEGDRIAEAEGEAFAEADGEVFPDGVGLAPGVFVPQAANTMVKTKTAARMTANFFIVFLLFKAPRLFRAFSVMVSCLYMR